MAPISRSTDAIISVNIKVVSSPPAPTPPRSVRHAYQQVWHLNPRIFEQHSLGKPLGLSSEKAQKAPRPSNNRGVRICVCCPRRAGQIRNHPRAARPCSIQRRVGIPRVEKSILTLGIRILILFLPRIRRGHSEPRQVGGRTGHRLEEYQPDQHVRGAQPAGAYEEGDMQRRAAAVRERRRFAVPAHTTVLGAHRAP